jgi:hypothetical protein
MRQFLSGLLHIAPYLLGAAFFIVCAARAPRAGKAAGTAFKRKRRSPSAEPSHIGPVRFLRRSTFVVAALMVATLLSPDRARASEAPPVEATIWQSASFAANTDTATQTGGALSVDVPLPLPASWLTRLNEPRFGATLEISSQPNGAFSFTDVNTFGRALRFDLNVREPFASTKEGEDTYTLALYGQGGFTTMVSGVDDTPRQRYAREWAIGVHLDAPGGAWFWTGLGHSSIVNTEHRMHWLGGGQTPVPVVGAVKIGIRFAVDVFRDKPGTGTSFDNAFVYVGLDPVKVIKSLAN